MHITVVVFGTWGDLRPNVVLAQALKNAGHSVQVLTTNDFEAWVRARDLDYAPINVNIQKLLDDVTTESNLMQVIQTVRQKIAPAMIDLATDTYKNTREADVVLVHEAGTSVLSGAIEANKLLEININLQPMTPTKMMPSSFVPASPNWMPFRGTYNRLTYTFTQATQWMLFGSRGNEFRTKNLNLAKMTWRDYQKTLQTVPTITAVSEHLLPYPPDWKKNHHLTGFLFDDDPDWQPPQALIDFLNTGDKPFYVGFGSMSDKNPEETTQIIVEAMKQTNKRAIILSGWAGIGQVDIPENIYILNYAPHSWLFPRMSAVIHHGGAGTIAAGVRAGVPSIIVPHLGDQSYWGNLLYQNGVAPQNIPRPKLSVERLVEAINEVSSSSLIKEKARILGEKIRTEDSIQKSLTVIENAIASHKW